MARVRVEEDFVAAHITSGVTKPEDKEEDEDGPEPGDPVSGVLSIVKLIQRCCKSGKYLEYEITKRMPDGPHNMNKNMNRLNE